MRAEESKLRGYNKMSGDVAAVPWAMSRLMSAEGALRKSMYVSICAAPSKRKSTFVFLSAEEAMMKSVSDFRFAAPMAGKAISHRRIVAPSRGKREYILFNLSSTIKKSH